MKVGKYIKLPALLFAVLFAMFMPLFTVGFSNVSLITPVAQAQEKELTDAQIQNEAEKKCGTSNSKADLACRGGFRAGYSGSPSIDTKCNSYPTQPEKDSCREGYEAGDTLAQKKGDAIKESDKGCGTNFDWVLCGIIRGAENTVGFIEDSVIEPFLDIPPLLFNQSPIYDIWKVMRDLANGLFVLVFLVFIFAQTLSLNLDAYAIRKIIPKLVAAAILVQLSYLLSALAIDIFNVFGHGLFLLTDTAIPAYTPAGSGTQAGSLLALTALVGGAAALAATSAITITLIPIMIGVFFAAMAVFFTLMFRQVMVVLLVITAPLAIVLWILPSTEKMFKKWLSLFIKILFMYPLIIMLFAAGKLFSSSAGATGGTLSPIFALVGVMIPLFLIPLTFKYAGGVMGSIGSFIAKRGAGAGKKTNDKFMDDLKSRRNISNVNKAAGLKQLPIPRVLGGRALSKAAGHLGTGHIMPGSRTQSNIALATQKAIEEDSKRLKALNLSPKVNSALSMGTSAGLTGADLTSYNQHSKIASTWTGRAAAANQLANMGAVKPLNEFRKSIDSEVTSGRMTESQGTQLWSGAKSGAFGEIKKQDALLAMGGFSNENYTGQKVQDNFASLTPPDVAGMNPDRIKEYVQEGVRASASQIAAATSDRARENMTPDKEVALARLLENSMKLSGAASPSPQQARLDSDIDTAKLNVRMRYDLDPSGNVDTTSTRNDTVVREITKKYAKDVAPGGYRDQVNDAVQRDNPLPPPT